jgi:hypothetical protein
MKILYTNVNTFEIFDDTIFLVKLKSYNIINEEKCNLERKGKMYSNLTLK